MKGRRPNPTRAVEHSSLPPCPPGVGDAAKVEWDRVTAVATFTAADYTILIAYVQSWAGYVEAERRVREGEAVVEGKKSAWVQVMDTHLKQLRAMAAELGLTPASRGRLANATTPTEPETGALEDFLNG